jgi:polyphosphate kinase 2 (PPK2 family)
MTPRLGRKGRNLVFMHYRLVWLVILDMDQKLKREDYEVELLRLRVELVKGQQEVVHKGRKICIVSRDVGRT